MYGFCRNIAHGVDDSKRKSKLSLSYLNNHQMLLLGLSPAYHLHARLDPSRRSYSPLAVLDLAQTYILFDSLRLCLSTQTTAFNTSLHPIPQRIHHSVSSAQITTLPLSPQISVLVRWPQLLADHLITRSCVPNTSYDAIHTARGPCDYCGLC